MEKRNIAKTLNVFYNAVKSGVIFHCELCNQILQEGQRLSLIPCTHSGVKFKNAVHKNCARKQYEKHRQ